MKELVHTMVENKKVVSQSQIQYWHHTMAWLLHCCLQKMKTVNFETVKKPTLITHKDLRLTKINDFYSREYGIMSKIEPKETRVDPKNTKNVQFMKWNFFCGNLRDWGFNHGYPIYAPSQYISTFKIQTLLNIVLYSKNHLWL